MPDQLSQAPLTQCLSAHVLTKGTTTTLTTTGAINFVLKGRTYTKTTMTNAAMPTTDVNTSAAFVKIAAGFGAIILVGLDKSGNIKMAQGPSTALDGSSTDGASALFVTAPAFPALPDTVCPIGFAVVLAGSGGTGFTPGTTTWTSGSSNATTWGDLNTVPDRLIVLGV